jgi:hypothetical protein
MIISNLTNGNNKNYTKHINGDISQKKTINLENFIPIEGFVTSIKEIDFSNSETCSLTIQSSRSTELFPSVSSSVVPFYINHQKGSFPALDSQATKENEDVEKMEKTIEEFSHKHWENSLKKLETIESPKIRDMGYQKIATKANIIAYDELTAGIRHRTVKIAYLFAGKIVDLQLREKILEEIEKTLSENKTEEIDTTFILENEEITSDFIIWEKAEKAANKKNWMLSRVYLLKIQDPYLQDLAYAGLAELAFEHQNENYHSFIENIRNPNAKDLAYAHMAKLLWEKKKCQDSFGLIRKIKNPSNQNLAYARIALFSCETNNWDTGAYIIIRGIGNPLHQNLAYAQIAELAAKNKNWPQVYRFIENITNPAYKNLVYGEIAEIAAKNKDYLAAKGLIQMIKNPFSKNFAYNRIVELTAKNREYPMAQDIAKCIIDPDLQIFANSRIEEIKANHKIYKNYRVQQDFEYMRFAKIESNHKYYKEAFSSIGKIENPILQGIGYLHIAEIALKDENYDIIDDIIGLIKNTSHKNLVYLEMAKLTTYEAISVSYDLEQYYQTLNRAYYFQSQITDSEVNSHTLVLIDYISKKERFCII